MSFAGSSPSSPVFPLESRSHHSAEELVQRHWCIVAGNAASHSPLLISDLVACADPEICQKICGNPSGCSDIAYPKLVLELLPVGKSLLMVLALVGLAHGSHRYLGGKFREENTLELSFQWGFVGQTYRCHFKLE